MMPEATATRPVGTEDDVFPWHARSVDDVFTRLGSGRRGLSTEEARHRLAATGPNALQVGRRASPWRLLAAQFSDVLIVILLVATALSAMLGHAVEAAAITVIVVFAVLLGFVEEFRAERAIEALLIRLLYPAPGGRSIAVFFRPRHVRGRPRRHRAKGPDPAVPAR